MNKDGEKTVNKLTVYIICAYIVCHSSNELKPWLFSDDVLFTSSFGSCAE